MKRHPSLHALSEEHHLGLVNARRLRRAAGADPAAAAEAARAFPAFGEQHLAPHFRAEEEPLLPRFALYAADHPLTARTLLEHVRTRRWALDVRCRIERGDDLRADLAWMGRFLDDHIRFGERILFPAIEQAVPEPGMEALAAALAAYNVA